MKKVLLSFAALSLVFSIYSCRETTEEKTEDAVESMGEDMERAAEDAGDAMENAAGETGWRPCAGRGGSQGSKDWLLSTRFLKPRF